MRSAVSWQGKKTATSPETAACGTDAGVDQNDESLCHGLHLPVVAGELPINLYIQRRIHRYRISRGLPTVIGDVIIRVDDYEDPDGRDNARKLVEAWQRRWDLSQKGRHTYAFFPNVSSRLRTRWFVATHYIKQMSRGIQGKIA